MKEPKLKEVACKVQIYRAIDFSPIYEIEVLESLKGVNFMRFDPASGILEVSYDIDPTDTTQDDA